MWRKGKLRDYKLLQPLQNNNKAPQKIKLEAGHGGTHL